MLIHPHEDRGLSIREAARIQSVPDNLPLLGFYRIPTAAGRKYGSTASCKGRTGENSRDMMHTTNGYLVQRIQKANDDPKK